MGYYTDYTLHIKGIKTKEECKSIIKNISDLENNCLTSDSEPEAGFFLLYSDNLCKWYNSTEDMREISKKYPHCAFMLEGKGEDSGDVWREYFLNGKSDFCVGKITFDKPELFDWNKFPDNGISSLDGDVNVCSSV